MVRVLVSDWDVCRFLGCVHTKEFVTGARSVEVGAYANTRGSVLNARSVVAVAYANTRGSVLHARSVVAVAECGGR